METPHQSLVAAVERALNAARWVFAGNRSHSAETRSGWTGPLWSNIAGRLN